MVHPRHGALSLAEFRPVVSRRVVSSLATTPAALPVSARSPMGGAGSADALDAAPLIAFVVMCFGMFMAFLDIQIVSASLSEIQAGLSASADEIPWVQTAYLIAEVIAIPLSGFLSRALRHPRAVHASRPRASPSPA